jgi:hypothetical protein
VWEALLSGVAAVLEFLGLEALADRIAAKEEPSDPRNFPPPR